MHRAFQGANGWYVAEEDESGFHRQPSLGPWLSRSEAVRLARERNEHSDDDAPEYWGGTEEP